MVPGKLGEGNAQGQDHAERYCEGQGGRSAGVEGNVLQAEDKADGRRNMGDALYKH